jgi:hypothetical protein
MLCTVGCGYLIKKCYSEWMNCFTLSLSVTEFKWHTTWYHRFAACCQIFGASWWPGKTFSTMNWTAAKFCNNWPRNTCYNMVHTTNFEIFWSKLDTFFLFSIFLRICNFHTEFLMCFSVKKIVMCIIPSPHDFVLLLFQCELYVCPQLLNLCWSSCK